MNSAIAMAILKICDNKAGYKYMSNENNSLHVSDLSSASLNFTYEACHDCIFILAI
jgi:hypothetical protein